MRGFLKCYYGYKNLGDEILFFGVLDYLDAAYPHITSLSVEVEDERRMESRRDRNKSFLERLTLAPGFTSGTKTLKFVRVSKNIADTRRYDCYFFGGGEVFAESRGFHGGRNYLLRYTLPLVRKRFVLLGGIETATRRWQKLLYRFVLPRAQRVICREQDSYQVVKRYTDKVIYLQDFALSVTDRYKQLIHSSDLRFFQLSKPYTIVNIVHSMATDKNFEKIRRFLLDRYPDTTPVFVAGKSVNSDDNRFASWLGGAYPQLLRFDRTEYPLSELLALFDQARAGIASRLHILLLLQAFDKDRYALVYAEKVAKLIHSTLQL